MSSERPQRPRLRYRTGSPPRSRVQRTGGTIIQPADYAVSIDLPEHVPVTELELRTVEILLGSSLQDLLRSMPPKALKYRSK